MKALKHSGITLVALAALLLAAQPASGESVAEKARDKRIEIVQYMRAMKPMVFNFPCDPFPECEAEAQGEDQTLERIAMFNEVKQIYQQGMIYFYEGNYVNAYNRFLDSQVRVENLLEDLSQFYLDRAQAMMRDSIEPKNPDNPEDLSVVDISIEYGPNSRKRRDFQNDRVAPRSERRYDPDETRWAYNKYRIEKNVELGYRHLGIAKEVRYRALRVDSNLTRDQEIQPHHRKMRIELYLASIRMAQTAKLNASFIYALKYPFDNYALFNPFGNQEAGEFPNPEDPQIPSIEDVEMVWSENPYMLPKRLHPIFDLRVPEQYRRDLTDARDEIYTDEVEELIRLKYVENKPESWRQEGEGGENQPGG